MAETRQSAPVETRRLDLPLGLATLGIVTAVFIWWAYKQAAYFGTVFFPGAMLLYALLVLLLIGAPFRARLGGPARVALASIAALAAWTLLSILWTNHHDAAVQNGERGMLYATAFALGLWGTSLVGRRPHLPLVAIAVSGAVVGVVSTLTLAIGTDVNTYVHFTDATLRFPIGYRNAEAAFLLICLWPTICLAAEGRFGWKLEALLVGSATMLLDLAFLSQSRGSLPAAALALVVFMVLSPRRLRAATFLGIAILPMLVALPTLLDVFQHGIGGPTLLPLLRDAARATIISSLASVALAAVCLRLIEPRLHLSKQGIRAISWVTAVTAVGAVLIGGIAFVSKHGGPIKFLDQRVSEFRKVGYPDLSAQGTRFGANVGSNRHDFWRVAADEARDHPLLGGGAGSFSIAYLQHRRSGESPRDPHSVEMLILSELGIVGLALLVAFVVASVWAALRSRRRGPPAAMLVAGALASGAQWLLHSSYDWFWLYPGVTAPAMFLLGAAVAPSLLDREAGPPGRGRLVVAAGAGAALLIAVPFFFSARYENRAYGEYPANPAAALSDLDRAADLDPYDPEPLLAKGVIESRLGRQPDAVAAFREASDRLPDGYAPHFYLARALASSDPAQARTEAAEALRLNPLDEDTRALHQRLERAAAKSKKSAAASQSEIR